MTQPGSERSENVRDILIEEDLREAYINYAMSVIINRALPDVRDGLKPSQRRILVAMNDLNLGPRAKTRKCAKICGDTAGNYHPHPSSVYTTLVRMAQPFLSRYVLVQGQGNFGSLDGDPPAAVRYTEARLSEGAAELLTDIDHDTVDFVPNYDGTRQEPTVLPARFPNLLCNGSSGIAVGMMTNVPPHNVREICNALVHLIDHPEAGVDDLMRFVPGPDFPTGGIICGRRGIRDAYATGRGLITLRARINVEETKRGRPRLVVSEIPFQVTRSTIKQQIADAVNAGRIRGVSDFRDESDRQGQRLVIELRRDEDEQIVLNQLYKHTSLQESFSIIMLALVDKQPRTLPLKEMMQHYLDHRREVIRRRTAYRLRRAEERAHILEGLKLALSQLDAVIALIRASASPDVARQQLMERFQFSERQAVAILQMQLQRLTGMEKDKIEAEYRELIEKITEYTAILENEALVRRIIADELTEIRDRFGDDRSTEIRGAVVEIDKEDLIPEAEVVVTLTHGGYIKRLGVEAYRSQGRGGRGVQGAAIREGDFVEHLFTASTHDYILFFTDRGKVHWLKVYDLPSLARPARGRAVVNLLKLGPKEKVRSVIPVREFDDRGVVLATQRGRVKHTVLSAFRRPQRGGIIAIHLLEHDDLVDVRLVQAGQEVILGTRKGQAIRFPLTDVRPMGRSARGVRGIRLRGDDQVVGLAVAEPDAFLLTICEHGYGKRTPVDDYPVRHRGGYGVRNIATTERNGNVVGLSLVEETDDVMMISADGMIIRTPMSKVRPIGRATQGVRLINLKPGDRVATIARVAQEQDEPPEASSASESSPPPPEPES